MNNEIQNCEEKRKILYNYMKEKRCWIHIHMLIGRVLESMSHVNINNNKKEIYYICLYIYKYMFIHKLHQMGSVLVCKQHAKEQ